MPLRILILTPHFFPEVSAATTRFHELGRLWVAAGHSVTVVTCTPNHPFGRPYPGYRRALWQHETQEGIHVIRPWTYLAANKGFFRRTVAQASYLISATLAAPLLPASDIVVSSTPHIFCGMSGYPVSRLRRRPWVLDIRDLWPDSITAVGAMDAGLAMSALKAVERFGYRKASHIVSVSDAFVPHFEACGIARDKITVVTNGIDLSRFERPVDDGAFRRQHGLEGKFVAAYVGTHGMAHQLDVVLAAADRLRGRTDIGFLMVGDGAERERLVGLRESMKLSNVLMMPQVPRELVPSVLAASDVSLVTLRDTPLFELVIPSKMFEAMALRKPIVLGVRGEAQRIVEGSESGLAFPPGDAEGLARNLCRLADDPTLRQRLGDNGHRLATTRYSRDVLAQRYLAVLEATVAAAPAGRRAKAG